MAAWKEIGKNILKGTAVIVGTRLMTEKVVPAATEIGKEAWERIKNTKSTGKKSEPEILEPEEENKKATHKAAKMRVVNPSSRVYDADFDG